MPSLLPYRFDTSSVVIQILRGVTGLLLIIALGTGYSLFISRDRVAALQLTLSGLILAYFGWRFVGNLEASRGTISQDGVLVEPVTLYGIRLRGPAGRFSLQQFEAVRVERISPLAWAQGGPHERVALIGPQGAPDLLIARTSNDAGRALGQGLAAALGLRYMEEIAPY
jgi:hypothetical protein